MADNMIRNRSADQGNAIKEKRGPEPSKLVNRVVNRIEGLNKSPLTTAAPWALKISDRHKLFTRWKPESENNIRSQKMATAKPITSLEEFESSNVASDVSLFALALLNQANLDDPSVDMKSGDVIVEVVQRDEEFVYFKLKKMLCKKKAWKKFSFYRSTF